MSTSDTDAESKFYGREKYEPAPASKGHNSRRPTKPTTESEIALAFVERFANEARYCVSSGKWHWWTGVIWEPDTKKRAFHTLTTLARDYAIFQDEKRQFSMGRASFAAGAEKIAGADPTLVVTFDDWNQNPMLLGTPGGAVDLQTGELRTADQKDMITKLTAVAPAEQGSNCPLWMKFLSEAARGDAEVIRFLQQWFGCCLTANTDEQAIVFVWGNGGNGKGVLLNTIASIMRDYHKTAPMDTFMASHQDRHPTDMAGLAGARLVAASETQEGRRWDTEKLKRASGQDRVPARFMHQNFFEYMPTYKLTFIGNNKPRLGNVDEAMRRRLRMVQFNNKPKIVDKKLQAKLAAEHPAILRWIIDGCLDWQKNGLIIPKSVEDETDSYFTGQDTFKNWISDDCDLEPDNRAKWEANADLFDSWCKYAKSEDAEPGTRELMGDKFHAMGLEKLRTSSHRGWRGIQLKRPQPYQDRDDQ